jgi:hypothetical protein
MAKQAKTAFAIKSWDENTWDGKPHKEITGAKLTRAQIETTYTGDIEGVSKLQYLMSYVGDGTCGTFVGFEQITGTFSGKKGSFVVQHTGTFDAEKVDSSIVIVSNSATDELKGLRGTGAYHLQGHHESYPLTLEYDFEG